jgi:protein N-lysine methyltransferase METTL21A
MAQEPGSRSSSLGKDLLSSLEKFVPARINKAPSTTAVSFDDLPQPPLLLHEDLKEGCGGQLWPAGMVLAKYMLLHHSHDLADKTM